MAAHNMKLDVVSSGKGSENGQIQLILGPMFSGKTTELIRRMKRYQIANYSCLRIKYANDVRYDDLQMSTHDDQTIEAVSATELSTLKEKGFSHDVIGIDEGQFFSDVTSFSEEMANHGKVVIVAALDGTYQKKGFGDILNLVPLAESVVKLNAVCMKCYRDASFTKRKGAETEIEVIGGADKYLAVCRSCYISTNNSPNQRASHPKSIQSTNQRVVLGEVENVPA